MYARMNGGFENYLGKRVKIVGKNGSNWSSKTHPYESVMMAAEQSEFDVFTMG